MASASSGIGDVTTRPSGSPRQPDRRGHALVEDQVKDGEESRKPVRQQVVGRHADRDAGCADLPLRPYQPLRDRRLGHQKRPPDLRGGQAAEHAQGQCDLGVERERGVAAREHQAEPLIDDRGVHLVLL
jgi:hypothetical protein